MENSKLIRLMQSLNGREWRSLGDFVRSPYFNRNADVMALYDWLAANNQRLQTLKREEAFTALYPGRAFDDAALNHLMSFLLKLCERFIGQEQLEKDGFTVELSVLQGLAQRGQEKHYHYLFDRKIAALESCTRRDASHFQELYTMENMEANRRSRAATRQFNEHVQRTADNLDAFYIAEKLRCTCYMLTSQIVIATPYNLQLVDEICRFTGAHPEVQQIPPIGVYYRIFRLLTDKNADADFEALKMMLKQHEKSFGPEEMAELYQYAINYCNFQIMKAREQYVSEALDLYIEGIESGVLIQDGQLSPWHFKNVIKLGLRLRKYEWMESFILRNNTLLATEFRYDALHYNLAELYYYTNRYDEAMLQLIKVEFTDVHYNVGSKVILAKIYYETEAYDALENLLHAFKTYLHRNKLIAEDLRRTYLNFIRVLSQIIRSAPENRTAIRENVEKMQMLAAKNWLLRIT